MKRKVLFSLPILALAALATSLSITSKNQLEVRAEEASETDKTPDFRDDFESYLITPTDGEPTDMGTKWTNGWFEKTGDGNERACAPDRFGIVADPTNENNKVLHVDTATSGESFFYLTMKDLYVRDFRLTYKMYAKNLTTTPWTGFNFRKPEDGRYNGVTNVMMTIRTWAANNFGAQCYRSVADSFMNVPLAGPSGEYGEAGADSSIGYNAENFPDIYKGAAETWLNIKIEAIGSDFKAYVNDQLLGQTTITKKTANNYGYVSLVSCVNDAYYDDIYLENLDTEPYNPGGEDQGDHPAPTMETTTYDVKLGEACTVNVNLGGEAITSLKQAKNEVLSQYYTVDGNSLTISKDYLAKLGAGRWNFTLTTAGGTVGFVIGVTDSNPSSSTDTSESKEPTGTDDNKPSSNGCGGSIIGTSVAAVAALGAVIGVALVKLKKKE